MKRFIGHWSLLIISLLSKKGYIADSINKHKSRDNYALSFIIEEVFGVRLDWEMVKLFSMQCKQQKSGWECGFCLIKNMNDLINVYQHDFPDSIWNEKKLLTHDDINELVVFESDVNLLRETHELYDDLDGASRCFSPRVRLASVKKKRVD
ncbi:hypothetical protein R6Q57_015715 [Mikania cordata]